MARRIAELADLLETLSDEDYAAVVAAVVAVYSERPKTKAGVAYGLFGPATNEELDR